MFYQYVRHDQRDQQQCFIQNKLSGVIIIVHVFFKYPSGDFPIYQCTLVPKYKKCSIFRGHIEQFDYVLSLKLNLSRVPLLADKPVLKAYKLFESTLYPNESNR